MDKLTAFIFLCLCLLIIFLACCAESTGEQGQYVVNAESNDTVQVGDIIVFGDYEWLVLEVNAETMLIITKNIIFRKPFHNTWEGVTWEESTLRHYLNNDFLDTFTEAERKRILPNATQTPDNWWWRTRGGNYTTDYIFLLSIEEVLRFFGDNGQMMMPVPYFPWRRTRISDEYNPNRVAFCRDGIAESWWLRSPGFDYDFIAFVFHDGIISIDGGLIVTGHGHWRYYSPVIGGVRPVLLLDMGKSSYINNTRYFE